ncbi:coenzyme F420-0:L-glutamate ligase [Nocardioides anomalus]|uniref:Coenzyme F420-0:L-glutamate ligase n=1 Tax=Nocardioides anomalus TaxID=2712223 RepID=A0A6G6WFM9_9ACTN|nr:coenzyme F420-0:L-glutamate ligase [Nocardioides anomalus]QIG44042.1 coenzyme F420-0:L-glutamate ligase [Nocardioides anomalus]
MSLTVLAPDGVPEVRPGDDLAALVSASLDLEDGDVVLVTSKVVSKAEGRLVPGTDRDAVLPAETVRIVARRGPTTIVRNRLGLTMAAAGIDNSNVEAGSLALLPLDPDASARVLRENLAPNVAVVITDTAGRAWRTGQTDIAIGAAGLVVLDDHSGRVDDYGNRLAVTAPAVADELASAAELAQGKLTARPFARVRGRADLVLPRGEHGPGAVALQRVEGEDLFGYGAREAVVRALAGDPADRAPFGAPAAAAEVAAAVRQVLGAEPEPLGDALGVPPDPRLAPLAFAFGWALEAAGEGAEKAVIRPATP